MEQKLCQLKGLLERITYQNEENDYVVARVKVSGHSDLITVIGNISSPVPGEILNMTGEWVSHQKYGQQFKIVTCTTSVPASVTGITKYLSSGLIKGIGPVTAKRIVSKFGESTLDVIENHVDKLMTVPGIGKNKAEMINKAWSDQKEVRTVMLFLQSNGISSGYASKIYKQYGRDSIAAVKENPYRLAHEIHGIGFIIADRIAQSLGFDLNSLQRAEAGILYLLHKLTEEGHVYYPFEALLNLAADLLKIDGEILISAMKNLEAEGTIVTENLKKGENIELGVFLAGYHLAELQIARMLKLVQTSEKRIKDINTDKALEWVQGILTISLADKQIEAIRAALVNKVLVITGGPGVGKTTIIKSILQIFCNATNNILLAAPTGRAAKRMSEATGFEAKTIHRLLEYAGENGKFQKNAENLLNCDLLIIDEASMVDNLLMYHLMSAVPKFATVIFVGDVQQLPSVGAGNVLKDIIDSGAIPVIELNQIFRQAQKSAIIVNSHKIINGQMPEIDNRQKDSDFFFIREGNPVRATEKIASLVKERIPRKFGFNPFIDIQVLAPMNRGEIGTEALNNALQQILNPSGFEIIRNGRKFRIGDKVMQIRNNYDREVFNGDLGFILDIIPENQSVTVNIDGRDISYDYSDLEELVLAYAVSVHKSQGSEYPAVIIPIMTQHNIMLARNLIYTGITRGKKLVILVGSLKAMSTAVQNNKTAERYTWLSERLKYIT